MQYSDRGMNSFSPLPDHTPDHALAMSQLAFDHLLNLPLSWHVRRKTGEVLRILDRGAAINRTLEVRNPTNSRKSAHQQRHSLSCLTSFPRLSTLPLHSLSLLLSLTGH